MEGPIILCFLLLAIRNVASVYFHELSSVLVTPTLRTPESDFGFSMGFQNSVPAKLIIGAPRSDFIGKVYSCPLMDLEKNVSCELLDIDMKNLAPYSLAINPSQYFYLGASVAATPNYFFTCAPLWTANIVGQSKRSDVFGTCFVYNGTFVRYSGTFERLTKRRRTMFALASGGIGWSSFYDSVNNLILLGKTCLKGDIVYMSSENTTKDTISLYESQRDKNIKQIFDKFTNIGLGIAVGNFFSNTTVYAFSMTSIKMTGQIAFLKYNKNNMLEFIMNPKNKAEIFFIINKVIGSMFGAVLTAEDLNRDGYSELIVGAPAQYDDDDKYEQGAVYIFIGGDMEINNKTRMRVILASKEGSRFGSAISTNDLDGDGIPEMFVSSPYEDSGLGAVYIISGLEVKNLLERGSDQPVQLSDFKLTQRLQAEGFQGFGYSLQVLSDLDSNGCNEIAIGAPGNDSVLLYRCVPAIKVALSAKLLGAKFVKEDAKNFVVEVCVSVAYQLVTSAIAGNLMVKTEILEDGPIISKPDFEINLSEKKPEYCNTVNVTLNRDGPGVYKFNAHAELDLVKNKTLSETKDFNKTWVTLSEASVTTTTVPIVRRCDHKNCDPKLNMTLHLPGSKYTLGSSEKETVSVVVRNDGHDSYTSCVWINVTGARIEKMGCKPIGDSYQCLLKSPLKRDNNESIDITLDMSKTQSKDIELAVEAHLYELCDQPEYTKEAKKMPYVLSSKQINIEGLSSDRNITDVEIQNEENDIIISDHEYEIINSGSVTWVDIYAVFMIEKKPFMQTCNISLTNCTIRDEVKTMLFSCKFTLKAHSSIKPIVSVGIKKYEIEKNLIDGQLNTTSEMELYLHQQLMPKNKRIIKTIKYFIDRSIINNLPAIIFSAIICAVLVLGGFIFILYKVNFFKRDKKKQLNELRESIRRRTVKRNAPESTEQNKSDNSVGSIEVIEESPVDASPRTSDDIELL